MALQTRQSDPAVEIIAEKRHARFQRWRLARIVRRVLRDPEAGRAAQDEFLGSLAGSLPGPTADHEGTVLVACDRVYLERFGPSFVQSLARAQDARVHLHLCDGRAEDECLLGAIGGTVPAGTFSWTIGRDPAAESLRYRTVYYTAARFLLSHELMRRTRGPVLCMDIDALFRRSPWPSMREALGRADLVITERPEWKQATRRTLAGVVTFNDTQPGTAFADAFARALRLGLAIRPLYHLDQILITYLIERMRVRQGLRVAPLPDGFLTRDADTDAVAYVPKGWSGKGSDAFAREQARVLGNAP